MDLSPFYRREQSAFLRRGREAWGGHLERIRAFLGEGLRQAPPGVPLPVLGAGAGLEVPWACAPAGALGWDADPWSRVRTFLRHRRWAPWVFADLTGGMDELGALVARTGRQPWSGRYRDSRSVALRLAGLLDSLRPEAGPLRAWIREHRPATILSANVMGQFGFLAQRVVELGLPLGSPWNPDPDQPDPLAQALDAWTARTLRAYLAALRESGADLWLVHDLAVLQGDGPLVLEPGEGPWTGLLRGDAFVEARDPLVGVDVLAELGGRAARRERWLWILGPGQTHVMEALHVPGPGRPCS